MRDDHLQAFPNRKVYAFKARSLAESSRHAHSVPAEREATRTGRPLCLTPNRRGPNGKNAKPGLTNGNVSGETGNVKRPRRGDEWDRQLPDVTASDGTRGTSTCAKRYYEQVESAVRESGGYDDVTSA